MQLDEFEHNPQPSIKIEQSILIYDFNYRI
jgi:hypothetical protein